MDPKACLIEARESALAYRNQDVRSCLTIYREWRRKQGFEPTITVSTGSGNTLTVRGDEFARTLERNIGRLRSAMPGILTLEVCHAN